MKRDILQIVFVAAVVVLASCSNGADPAIGASVAETKNPTSVTFSLSGVNYRFTLPEGYCKPWGKGSEFADAIAALDPQNMTHFTIVPCEEAGRDSGFTRWGMLKTPRSSIGKRIPTRQQWVEDARNRIKRRDLVESFAKGEKLAGKTFKDLFGDDAKIDMHIEMVDVDEYACYMITTLLFEIAGEKELTAGAGAATVVRGNLFCYQKYKLYEDLSSLADLLKQVKSGIRGFVTDNPD